MKKLNKIPLPYLALIIGILFSLFTSPKWSTVWAPWITYPLILFFIRNVKLKQAFLWGIPALYLSGLIGGMDVIPMPMPFFLVFALIFAVKAFLPYLVDKLLTKKYTHFLTTLIFPAAMVSLEYWDSFGGGGTWGSVSNTQFNFGILIQIVSVTGIWGVSFLIYWFASIVNWLIERQWNWNAAKRPILFSSVVYLSVLGFGTYRLINSADRHTDTIKIAGITLDNTEFLETAYKDLTGKRIQLPLDLSQTAPELQEASKAFVKFIENPHDEKFRATNRIMEKTIEELFELSQKQANEGAKIIVWSEAIAVILKENEGALVNRAESFSKNNGVYLIMAVGTIVPGVVDGKRMHIENKTITIDPRGNLVNSYLKSNPVPFAEINYGSDGIIPVIKTKFGVNISPVICYDADFNHFVRQAGENSTDILVVPSADWKAIDPYHSYMAAMRGLENGFSVVRPVSRSLSIATDPYGRITQSMDFYSQEEKTFLAEVPVKRVSTLYLKIGDIIAYFSVLILAIGLSFPVVDLLRKLFHNTKFSKQLLFKKISRFQ